MTPRTHVNLRLSPDGIARADELAHEHGLTRSEVLRLAIKVGFRDADPLRVELTKARERL